MDGFIKQYLEIYNTDAKRLTAYWNGILVILDICN